MADEERDIPQEQIEQEYPHLRGVTDPRGKRSAKRYFRIYHRGKGDDVEQDPQAPEQSRVLTTEDLEREELLHDSNGHPVTATIEEDGRQLVEAILRVRREVAPYEESREVVSERQPKVRYVLEFLARDLEEASFISRHPAIVANGYVVLLGPEGRAPIEGAPKVKLNPPDDDLYLKVNKKGILKLSHEGLARDSQTGEGEGGDENNMIPGPEPERTKLEATIRRHRKVGQPVVSSDFVVELPGQVIGGSPERIAKLIEDYKGGAPEEELEPEDEERPEPEGENNDQPEPPKGL